MLKTILYYTGIATWVAIILWLLLRLIFGKNWMLKVGSNLFLGAGLMQSAKKLKNEIKEGDIKDDTVTEVAVRVFWRLTKIGLISLIIAGLPVWLLFQQNRLIGAQNKLFKYQNKKVTQQTDLLQSQDKRLELQNRLFASQNDLFTDQNKKIDLQSELFQNQNYLIRLQKVQADSQISLLSGQNSLIDTQNYRINIQNNLLEADRRSSLVFLMSNILDKVSEEIKEQKKSLNIKSNIQSDSIKFSLTKPLINRIVGLSRAFSPYRKLSNNLLSTDLVSPERGQLFIALMESNLDSLTQNTIVVRGDFSYALIGSVDLNYSNFGGNSRRGVFYREAANFSNSNMRYSVLRGADLSFSNLSGADLYRVLFRDAKLNYADLSGANLWGTSLWNANLQGANLSNANLEKTTFNNTNLRGVNFENVEGLTIEQLKEAESLYGCTNLAVEIREQLKKEKPCLFTQEGCRN